MNTVLVAFVAFGLGVLLSQFIFTQIAKLNRKND